MAKQLGDYGHVSNLAMHPVGIELAERLIELAGRPGRVFFCNSGTEANEAAFKVARLTGRTTVYAAQGGFPQPDDGRAVLTGQPPNVPPSNRSSPTSSSSSTAVSRTSKTPRASLWNRSRAKPGSSWREGLSR